MVNEADLDRDEQIRQAPKSFASTHDQLSSCGALQSPPLHLFPTQFRRIQPYDGESTSIDAYGLESTSTARAP